MRMVPEQRISERILVSWARRSTSLCTLFILGLIGLPVSAHSQESAKRFDAWEVSCPATGNPTEAATPSPDRQTSCRLSQRLAANDTGQTVFALTIVKGTKKDDLVGIVSIPLGGYIAPGIEMRVDGKKTYKLLVETCNTSGCHAGFPIPLALQKEWGRAKELSFRIWTAKAKPADIGVTLTGFDDGLKNLRERAK